jgi:putative nucleotidyltransferase with HDIG domain
MLCYADAIALASDADAAIRAEALRRLGVIHYLRTEHGRARTLYEESYTLSVALGDNSLVAEAVNALAGLELEAGDIPAARAGFVRALALAGSAPILVARIEQNLGILANIQGQLSAALDHYERSLAASREAGDDRSCAIAYHNLGMICADRKLWDDADAYFTESLLIAERLQDVHLQGLCLLNHSEVHVARQRYDAARRNAETALGIFDRLGARLDKADAYKILGVVFRETGRPALAEARFLSAIELASGNRSVLSEAEASRELARLYQDMGRNQDALRLLNVAHRLFSRLDARVDLVDVAGKVLDLESTYRNVVRNWGRSIESADTYTFGHCERVADYAVAVARALGLDDSRCTTVRLGAYLHDVGKVRVPHEILNKPGGLTAEELVVMQQHPLFGLELLASVEFPWDLKPIIRSHHEKYDGSGYPDGLVGDEIPLDAQIICIVDVYDALTTTRSYRAAMPREAALAAMRGSRRWWRADVFDAFMRSVARSEAPA